MNLLSRLLRRRTYRTGQDGLIERLGGPDEGQPAAALDGIVHLLFDDAPFGLMVVDRAGGIIRVNEALRRMVGRGVDVSRHAPAERVFSAETREAAWAEVAPVLAGRQHAPRDFAARLEGAAADAEPDEAWDPTVSVSVAVLREADGAVSGALLRLSDITLQRQLEAQLAQSQKLQAVGQLAGGIAHDFNNLLTAVLGAADSIAARAELDEETREDVAQISASAQRGAALVRQLLAFGRRQTLQPRVLTVNDAISDLTGLLRRLLGGKIRLELELETPGLMVRVDPTQLDQVLVNLAVNARDAMAGGGVLTLRSGHMTLYRPLARGAETIPPGRYVMVEVRDTGAGIPPEVLPRIFDPFFTTKPAGEGTGLGLSLSFDIVVKQHGGTFEVETEPDAFTEFIVTLPRAMMPAAGAGRGGVA